MVGVVVDDVTVGVFEAAPNENAAKGLAFASPSFAGAL